MENPGDKFIIVLIAITLLSLIIFLSLVFVFIHGRRVLLQTPCNKFLFSLLCSHILSNTIMLALNIMFVKEEVIPAEPVEHRSPIIRKLGIASSIVKLVVSMNVVLITLDRFLSIKLHLHYQTWWTTRKQCIVPMITWLIPMINPLINLLVGKDQPRQTKNWFV